MSQVLVDPCGPVLEQQPVTWQQLVDALEQGALARRVSRAEHFGENGQIRGGLDEPAGQNRLDLRSEHEDVLSPRPVQWFHAEPIAREQQASSLRIPEREREHSTEPVHAVGAPFLVGVDDCFGVGSRAEGMAARLELAPQAGVVVDLAIEHDPHAAVFVRERLRPGAQIHDAQALVGEHGPGIGVQAGGVGSAVAQDVAHAGGAGRRVRSQLIRRDETGNAAHRYAATIRVFAE